MIARWRHLHRNVGTFAVVRTVLVLAMVIAAAVALPIAHPGAWPVPVCVAAGLILPWVVRDWLVERAQVVVRYHRYGGYGILIGVVVLREPIRSAGPAGLAAALGAIALYMSIYFWLLSDPRIEGGREDRI